MEGEMKSRFESRIRAVAMGIAAAVLAAFAAPSAFAQGATRVNPQYQQTQSGQTGQASQLPNQNQPSQQQAQPGQQPPLPAAMPRGGDLVLGPGDVISIQVADDADIAGKYLVSDSGDIAIPTVPNPIHAAGLNTSQLSKAIAKGLKDAQILNDPIVSIFVEEYHSHTVTVLGAVVRPGSYPVETHTTVLDVISEAGGLLPSAGNLVTIAKRGTPEAAAAVTAPSPRPVASSTPARAQNSVAAATAMKDASFEKAPVVLPENGNVRRIDLHMLVTGKDVNANIEVKAGDVVSVGTAPVVYIVGAVTRPGAFAIEGDKSEITVLQALSLVEGMTPVAASSKAVIVRDSADKNREEIPININKVMSGKEKDQYLLADDILFIPESGRKKTLQKAGQAAVGAAQYGLGLRVATF
jgi:polysaccharide biosynthesis/export protein